MNCAPPPQTCSHYPVGSSAKQESQRLKTSPRTCSHCPVGSSTKQESQELRKPPQKCSHCSEESSTKQESKGLKARLQMCSHYSVGSPTKQCGIPAVYTTSNIPNVYPTCDIPDACPPRDSHRIRWATRRRWRLWRSRRSGSISCADSSVPPRLSLCKYTKVKG